jgi:hypothetical protein
LSFSTQDSAYRSGRAARTLTLDLRYGLRDTAAVFTFLGVLLLGAAGSFWFAHASADIVHVTAGAAGEADGFEDRSASQGYEEHEVGPLTLSKLYSAWVGGVPRTEVHWEAHWAPALLFLLAFAAFLGPRFTAGRASLTLDERNERVSILRDTFGSSETIERSLRELREATLTQQGRMTQAHLVFDDGEHIEIAATTTGEAGLGRLVEAVNAFISSRA